MIKKRNCFIIAYVPLITILLRLTEASLLHHGHKSSSFNQSMRLPILSFQQRSIKSRLFGTLHSLRGGQIENENGEDLTTANNDNDEERYSRQLFTLGARAHSLIRVSTIIIDGPTGSGLLYEAVKNLALSGVGKIIILTNKEDDYDQSHSATCSFNVRKEQQYFDSEMDDLGIMYKRGARAEGFPNIEETEVLDELELILEYVKRLNPNVKIQSVKRVNFIELIESKQGIESDESGQHEVEETLGKNPVFLSVDRPQSSQIALNRICRKGLIPFVSIDTAGCYGLVFCDFGDCFHVVDEDGEAPQVTLLNKVELSMLDDERKAGDIMVHCIDGEHHDVSKGDIVEFQKGLDGSLRKANWVVVFVQNPICFTAKLCDEVGERDQSLEELISQLNERAISFSRVKVPKKMSFMPLSLALENVDNPKKDLVAASDLDKSFDTNRRAAIMSSFEALDKFVELHDRLPNPLSEENASDCEIFQKLIESETASEKIVNAFTLCCKAKFAPLQAIYGALGAQEVLKAASGLYNPIQQFLLYDCDEILDGIDGDERTIISANSKAQARGLKYILGKKVARKLAAEKIFVVGSGAIGCERKFILKLSLHHILNFFIFYLTIKILLLLPMGKFLKI